MKQSVIVKQGRSVIIGYAAAEIVALLVLAMSYDRFNKPHLHTRTWYLVLMTIVAVGAWLLITYLLYRAIKSGGEPFKLEDNTLSMLDRRGQVIQHMSLDTITGIRARNTNRRAYYIVLSDGTGKDFFVNLTLHPKAGRRMIALALVPIAAKPDVAKSGPVAEALAAWIGESVDLRPDAPQEHNPKKYQSQTSPTLTAEAPKNDKHRVLKIVLFTSGIILVIVGVVSLTLNKLDSTCTQLAAKGVEATATTENLYLTTRHDEHRSLDYRTDDINAAVTVVATFAYTVNGQAYHETLHISYDTASHPGNAALKNLYNTVRQGSFAVRYLPSDPTKVRPASEFAAQGEPLCRALKSDDAQK